MRALMKVKDVELVSMPNLKRSALMTAFKQVKRLKMQDAGDLENMMGLQNAKKEASMRMLRKWGKKTVTIRNMEEMERASCYVGDIVIASGCCNENELKLLDLSRFVNLKELLVGEECFENVDEVKLIGLHTLESVVIGKNSFTKHKYGYGNNANRHFYLKDCETLKELKIDIFSFYDFKVCEIDNLASLEVIYVGEVNIESWNFYYGSLELKSILVRVRMITRLTKVEIPSVW